MKKIFIIIPAYNCGAFIGEVVDRIPSDVWRKISQLVIINDGSSDDTYKEIIKISGKYKKIKLINKAVNEGYALAQKTGFDYCLINKADIVVILHDDGQYAPEEMNFLLLPLEKNEVDIVQGSRILGGKTLEGKMPIVKFVGNRFLSKLENIISGVNLAEFHSGYMLYTRKALITIPYKKLSNTFHFDGEMIVVGSGLGLKIRELPISTNYRGSARSNLNPAVYLKDLLIIFWHYKTGYYN